MGSRQQSRFIAMMEDYGRTMELVETAQDSTGRSSEQFAKYQDTLEYKLNQLRNSWEQLRTTFVNSDIFKKAIDGINAVVSKLANLDQKQLLKFAASFAILGRLVVTSISKQIISLSSNIGQSLTKAYTIAIDESKLSQKIKDTLNKTKYTVDAELLPDIKEKLLELGLSTEQITGENIKLINEYMQQTEKLKEINGQITEIKNKGEQATLEEKEKLAILEQQEATLKNQRTATTLQLNSNGIGAGQLHGLTSNQESAGVIKQAGSAVTAKRVISPTLATGITSIVSSAVMTGVTMGFAGADFKTIGLSMVGTIGSQLIPMVLNKVLPMLLTAIAPVLPELIIGALVASLLIAGPKIYDYFMKKNDQKNDKEYQLEEEEKKLKEIIELEEKRVQTAKNYAKEQRETVDNQEKLKKEFKELSFKQIKTTEEQERYKEIVDEIKETMPEIIESYDEVTGELKVQEDIWDSIIKKQQKTASQAENRAIFEQSVLLDKQRKLIENNAEQEELNYNNKEMKGSAYRDQQYKRMSTKEYAEYMKAAIANYEAYEGYEINEGSGFDTSGLSNEEMNFIKKLEFDPGNVNQLKDIFSVLELGLDATLEDYETLNLKDYEEKYALLEEYKKLIDNDHKKKEEEIKQQRELQVNQEQQLIKERLISEGEDTNRALLVSSGSSEKLNNFLKTEESIRGAMREKTKKDYLIADSPQSILDYFEETGNERVKEYAEKIGLDSKQAVEDYLKEAGYDISNLEDIQDFLVDLETEALKNALIDSVNNQISDTDVKKYGDFLEKVNTLTSDEIRKELNQIRQEYSDSPEIITAYEDAAKNAQTIMDNAIDELSTITGKSKDFFSNWSADALDAYSYFYQGIQEEFKDETRTIDFARDIENAFSKAKINSPEIRNQILNTLDFSSVTYKNWDEWKKTAQESIKEITGKEMPELFDSLSELNSEYGRLNISIANEDELTEYLDDVKEKIDAVKDSRQDFAELNAKVAHGDILDIDEYDKYAKKIKELGLDIEDYLTIDEKGNIEAKMENISNLFESAWKKQLEGVQDQIDNLDKEHEQQIQLIKNERDKNLLLLEQMKLQGKILEQEQTSLYYRKQKALMDAQATGDVGLISAASRDLSNFIRNQKDFSKEDYDRRVKEINDLADESIASSNKVYYETRKGLVDYYNDSTKMENASLKQYSKDYQDKLNELVKKDEEAAKKATEVAEKVQDAWDKVTDAQEKVQDALDKIAEKEQDVIDKTKELNETIYGDGTFRSSLDPMYNYDNKLESINERLSDTKDALDNLSPYEDPQQYIQQYEQLAHEGFVNRAAQKQVYQSGINNTWNAATSGLSDVVSRLNAQHGTNMSTDLGKYLLFDGQTYGINFAYQDALANDELKKFLEEQVQKLNDYRKKIRDLEKEDKEQNKQMAEMRKNARDKIISIDEKYAKFLEEQAKKELDTEKEKYDAMKEANDDYLSALEDAINKERELRQKQNEWDELATKEKKLSLMQRDTSGSNQKEILNLEKEVQNDREKLLDSSIDDIIDSMKELYELQQETREMEIEYQEKLLESTNWMKLAEDARNGINSVDEAIEMFVQASLSDFGDNITSINDLTIEQKEKLLEEATTTAGELTASQAILNSNIHDSVDQLGNDIGVISNTTAEEVSQTIVNTSENLTTQAQYELSQVETAVDDAITKGEQALEDAIREVQNARDDYLKALADLEEAQKAARQAEEDARKAEQEANDARQQALADAAEYKNQKQEYDNYINYSEKRREAVEYINQLDKSVRAQSVDAANHSNNNFNNNPIKISPDYNAYATGGLVNYTGPAWVDGTPSKPEAFLSAEDTQRIGLAAQLLSKIPLLNSNDFNNVSTSITNSSVTNEGSLIEVHINVENISNDLDLDNALDKMKNAIWDAARPAGSAVILTK